jgi:hypothetical protein
MEQTLLLRASTPETRLDVIAHHGANAMISAGAHTSIEVLLATYNGAAFLREQIDSVLAQDGVTVRILARDDGSSDGTQAILDEYAAAHPDRFTVLRDAESTGSAKGNFLRLLRASTAPYVAFCDQDDVWLPLKLRLSLDAMHALAEQNGSATPLLVYTDLRVVDAELQPISQSLWVTNRLHNATTPKLSKLLSENVVTGCTALMNRVLADRMLSMPGTAEMHDHWVALVAAGTGSLAAVPEPTVLYRQHGGNVVGAMQDASQGLAQRYERLMGRTAVERRAVQYRADQAQARSLLELHSAFMQPEAQQTVAAFIALHEMSRRQRLRTIMRYDLWREGLQRRITMFADLLRS